MMKQFPKISVIIPVYKVEQYLRQCLDSVVNQTYQNLEIIVIDDGSPDNCGKICDEYAAKDERLRVIHKENEGLCAARNQGINIASGEWLAFVDSDDWISLNYYEELVGTVDTLGKKVDVVCASGHIIEFGNPQTVYSFQEENGILESNELDQLLCRLYMPPREARTNFLGPWDKLYRKSFVEHISARFEGRAWEDQRFNLVVFANRPIIAVSSVIGYHYRTVETSIMHGYNKDKAKINYKYLEWIHEYLEDHLSSISQQLTDVINVRAYMLLMNSLDCCYFHSENIGSYRTVAKEIKEMKTWLYYQKVIWSCNNQYLTTKQVVLKYILRLPWIWPLKLVYSINERIKSK